MYPPHHFTALAFELLSVWLDPPENILHKMPVIIPPIKCKWVICVGRWVDQVCLWDTSLLKKSIIKKAFTLISADNYQLIATIIIKSVWIARNSSAFNSIPTSLITKEPVLTLDCWMDILAIWWHLKDWYVITRYWHDSYSLFATYHVILKPHFVLKL